MKQTVPVDTSGTIPEDLGTPAPVTVPILPSSPCYYRSTHLFFTSAGQIHCIHCHPTDPLTFFYSTQLFSLMSNLYSQSSLPLPCIHQWAFSGPEQPHLEPPPHNFPPWSRSPIAAQPGTLSCRYSWLTSSLALFLGWTLDLQCR